MRRLPILSLVFFSLATVLPAQVSRVGRLTIYSLSYDALPVHAALFQVCSCVIYFADLGNNKLFCCMYGGAHCMVLHVSRQGMENSGAAGNIRMRICVRVCACVCVRGGWKLSMLFDDKLRNTTLCSGMQMRFSVKLGIGQNNGK